MSRRRINIEKKIAVLRAARKLVPKQHSICSSLYVAAKYDLPPDHMEAAESLRIYIMRSLNCSMFLEQWILRNGHAPKGTNMKSPQNALKMRATRIAWIDWMIACYEEDLAKLDGGAA